MQRELRDLYDANSNVTGLTYFKGDFIPSGYYPMVVIGVLLVDTQRLAKLLCRELLLK